MGLGDPREGGLAEVLELSDGGIEEAIVAGYAEVAPLYDGQNRSLKAMVVVERVGMVIWRYIPPEKVRYCNFRAKRQEDQYLPGTLGN